MTSSDRPTPSLTFRECLLYTAVPLYIAISIALFFTWVNPSLMGETKRHIAADSDTYMRFARSLRAGENDPFVLGSLASFPNTLWGPVLLALALNSTVAIVAFNYVLLSLSLWLITRATKVDLPLLLLLVFANVTTSISLLSLNKETLDFFAIALFLYYLGRGKRKVLFAALLISVVCRYETCVIMLLYLALQSRWNTWRYSRKTMLLVVTLLLSFVLSGLLSASLKFRLQEVNTSATTGGLLMLLDNLQVHYLFFVAVVPKILDNLFSELINVPHWSSYSWDDPANSFFLLGNNFANAGILTFLLARKRLRLRSNLVYLASLSAVCMSTALVIQPRYFYGAYILLCVEGARVYTSGQGNSSMREAHA